MRNAPSRILAFTAVLLIAASAAWAGRVPLKAARMIIEFNDSAQDVGIQFFLDTDGWQSLTIHDPEGRLMFNATASGSLLEQGGGTELFVESVEPPLDELPLDEFFARFPEGVYRFAGRSPAGDRFSGRVAFSHVIPAGPEIVAPAQPDGGCAAEAPIPLRIVWNPVAETVDGEPVDIVGYQVIVENEDGVFDVKLPGEATAVTVPAEFLAAGSDYIFEVLAIESGGNQTITEGCFTTAP